MLLLLILNDRLLKVADVLPGFLTGKISDFAGLMVFPLLIAIVLGRFGERKSTWIGIHVLTGLLFAAINLIPAAAAVYTDVLGTLGFTTHVWMDPSDLVALAALPVSCVVYPRLKPWISVPSLGAKVAAVAVAGFFCMASSSTGAISAPRNLTTYDGSLMVSDVAFINGTDSKVSVQVEKYTGQALDCTKPDTWGALEKSKNFKSLGTFSQKPGEVTTLLPAGAEDAKTSQCKAVRLTVNDIESVIVVWDPSVTGISDRPIQTALPIAPDDLPPNSILLSRERSDYYMLAKGKFQLTYFKSPKYAVDYWKM